MQYCIVRSRHHTTAARKRYTVTPCEIYLPDTAENAEAFNRCGEVEKTARFDSQLYAFCYVKLYFIV